MMRRPQRQYFDHRQAYAPRFWPVALFGLPFAAGWGIVIGSQSYNPVITVLLCFAVGAISGRLVVRIRWAIWKHRHPVLTPSEYLDRRRNAARWN